MIGLSAIGSYIPEGRVDNVARAGEFNTNAEFVANKVGTLSLARKRPDETVLAMCLEAFHDLRRAAPSLDPAQIECVCLCTQNGDFRLPHTSSPLQHALATGQNCAAFDLSLGCSGYVYAVNLVQAFMQANGMRKGLLFTCDPYPSVLDPHDKNTELLFGDAATVTLLDDSPVFALGKTAFLNRGELSSALIKKHGAPLHMNGQEVFNFVMRYVPANISQCLALNETSLDDIEYFLLHQGSKFLLDVLSKRIGIAPEKVPSNLASIGNTVSSSIPLLLRDFFQRANANTLLLCGFGVGLGSAATVLRRTQ